MLHSDDYSSLNPGFWVAYVGPFDDVGGATAAVGELAGAGYTGAYPRCIGTDAECRLAEPRATIRGCRTPPLRFAPPSTPTSTLRRQIEAGDATWLDLAAFFTDDAVYVDPAWGRVQGIDEIRSFFVESMRGLEDWRFPIRFTAIEGDEVVTVWDQVLPGERPDGRPYRQTGVSLLQYAGDGRFCFEEDLLNMTHVLEDLAASGWRPGPGFVSPPASPNRDVSRPHRRVSAMRTTGRRRLDRILLAVGAVVGGGIVAIGGAVGDGERIPQMWVGAELSAEGGTQVTEAIDYDFGLVPKHGIFRTIPGLAFDSVVTVASATAPDDIAGFTPVFIDGEPGMEVKVGDPNTTITGRHRYVLDYELPRDVLLDAADTLAWDAVGTKWTVTIQRAEIHIVAPWELEDATCHVGTAGSDRRLRAPRGRAGAPRDRGRGPRSRRGRHRPRRAGRGARRHAERPPASDDGAARSGRRPAAARRRGRHRRPGRRADHLDRSSAAQGGSASAPAASPTRPSPAAAPDQRGPARRGRPGRDGHHRLRAAHRAHPGAGRPAPRRARAARAQGGLADPGRHRR